MVVTCELAKMDVFASQISTNSKYQSILLRIDSHSSKQMQNASANHHPGSPRRRLHAWGAEFDEAACTPYLKGYTARIR